MKAVVSNRIYLETDAAYGRFLEKSLTYKIPTYNGEFNTITTYTKIRPGLYSIPVGRFDLIPKDYEIKDKRVKFDIKFPKFKFELRPSQQELYEDVIDNCLINAKVSYGKTFSSLAIAGKLGQRTLVVTHTLPLMYQWVDEIKKVYGITPGVIGDSKFDIGEVITVGSTKSLYNNLPKISKQFGNITLDEIHHCPSNTFTKIVDGSYARYKIGLSGTLERKDGLGVIIPDYFSKNIYKPPEENSMTPEVHIIPSGLRFSDSIKKPWALKVNELVQRAEYQALVIALVKKYEAQGHTVLVVSDRVEFLRLISKYTNSALITGETTNRDGEFAKLGESTNTLCGTQSIFSEGISHNPLSCLILTTPINNDPLLEQLIGRIKRIVPGKLKPVVVDITLNGNTATKQANSRLGHYIRNNYKITHVN